MKSRMKKGGFVRPFGCGWFIRGFLMGKGPMGSIVIDPNRGSCQRDIFDQYKRALQRAYAQRAIDQENDLRVTQKTGIYTELEYQIRLTYHLSRIPYRQQGCRYHSFSRYFHYLKQLEWVELTGEEEVSSLKHYSTDAPNRIYYRITRAGITAEDNLWTNPQATLYPRLTG